MKVTKLKTGVKILHYQSFFRNKMIVESKHLEKYEMCKNKINN